MYFAAARTEAEARDVIVEAVEPRVGERGEDEVFHRAAIDGAEGLAEGGFRLSRVVQLIAFRQEAGPLDLWRIVGEETVGACGCLDAGQYLLLMIGDRPA